MSPADPGGLLAFRVGPARAALPLDLVRQVLERPEVMRVPGTLGHVAGVALRAGIAVPVYDLGRFGPFWPGGTAPAMEPGDRMIVCGWGDLVLGLLGTDVDVLSESGREPEEGDADGVSGDFVLRRVRAGDGAVAVLDPDRLFPSLGAPGPHAADAVTEGSR